MEFRNLGNTGLKVSIAGIGCNNFGMRCDAAQGTAVVHAALDQGINLQDLLVRHAIALILVPKNFTQRFKISERYDRKLGPFRVRIES